MSDKYLIGVDIGTQGTKTSLFNINGKLKTESFKDSRLIKPKPGVVEQDAEEIYSSVLSTIKEVIEKSGINPSEVSAVGLDGQMAGIMGIDKEGNAITPYDSWLDTRCEKYIEEIKKKAEDLVIKMTGCPVTYAHGPKILWWKNERPEIYKKIKKFVVPTAFVAGRLTGLKADEAYMDYTHIPFSGFGNIKNISWSDELLDIFEVSIDKMPKIIKPFDIIGKIKKSEAKKCGLLEGTAVVAGCADQVATALGAGLTKSGIAYDGAGTASAFSCGVDFFNPDLKHKTLLFFRSVIPDLWMPVAYINGGGLCIRWFREQFTGDPEATYEELENEAKQIKPGSDGLVFLPHFGGRVCPSVPYVRGTWVGLNWSHTRAHLYRAILEGIAYEYSLYVRILKKLIGDLPIIKILATGGGSKSNLFKSIKADVLQMKFTTMKKSDTATLGGAVVAGYGVGLYSDIGSFIDKIVETGEVVKPNHENHKKYKKYAKIYEELFDDLDNSFIKLSKARGEI